MRLDARVRLHNDVSVNPTKLLAFADLLIEDAFVIKNIRILQKKEDAAPFVVYPAEKGRGANQERWFDIAHPINKDAREKAQEIILSKFNAVSSDRG